MLELLEPHNNLDPELDKAITQKIEYLLKKILDEKFKEKCEEMSKEISYNLSVEMAELCDKIIEQIAFNFYGGPEETNRIIDRLSIKSQLFLNGKL